MASSYRLADGSKIPARKVMLKGKSYVETELTMRDLEDTGEGFVVQKEAETPKKKGTGTKKTTTSSRGTKQSKSSKASDKKASSKKPTRKTRKAEKEEAEAETKSKSTRSKKTVKRRNQKADSAEPVKSKRSAKSKEKVEVKESTRYPLTFENPDPLSKIRNFLRLTLEEHLQTYHNNIEAVTAETVRTKEDLSSGEIRIHITATQPEPDHHSLDFYLKIAKNAGSTCKTPGETVQAKLAERLDVEDDADFTLEVGHLLLDESGCRLLFTGINKETKSFVLLDIDNEQIIELKYSGFDALDWTGSTLEQVMGPGIEDVKSNEDSVDDDGSEFDIEEQTKTPLTALDWENTEPEVLVELISDNYSHEELIEFVKGHEDLEPSKEDLKLDFADLVQLTVDVLTDTDEDFEEEGEDADLDFEDSASDDEIEDADFEEIEDEEAEDESEDEDNLGLDDDDIDDIVDEAEDEDEEAEDDAEEVEDEDEVELDAEMRKAMVAALVKAEELTPKMAKRLSDGELSELYSEIFHVEGEDEEDEDDEEELTVAEMTEALIESGDLTAKLAKRLSDEDIAELYAETFDAESVEDDAEDEDEDEVEDDEDLELE